ncbi:hypothetical protein Trco_003172 [Trichoderma cornu-damae]|uniref:Uncharacterized protein n=1 Tax=Trichoderma cornu-damae TaxID=654480 RepID=A0A9P8QRD0_9HYPO|nr:hypothetical protein Trco_003172 [Trichoderma cornu-damae]
MELEVIVVSRRDAQFAIVTHDYHPSSSGMAAARAVLRILRIFSCPTNRMALQQEASFCFSTLEQRAHITDKSAPGPSSLATLCHSPFPFATTCLHLGLWGTVFDPVESRQSDISTRYHQLQLTEHAAQWSELCEAAVIDITDLDRPRYCFLANTGNTEDVITYLRRFSTGITETVRPAEDQQVVDALSRFRVLGRSPVVPAELSELWRPISDVHTPYYNFLPEDEDDRADGRPRKQGSKSLMEMCTAKFLDQLLSAGREDDASLFDQVLAIAPAAKFAWEYCVGNAHRLARRPQAITLRVLEMLLRGKAEVNLAPFRSMRAGGIRKLLRRLPEARTINLSGTPAIHANEITATLQAIDHDLDALCLLTPPIGHFWDERVQDVLNAIKSWNRKCGKVLISSVLEDLSFQFTRPCLTVTQGRLLYSLVNSRGIDGVSKSFPVVQVIYRSTFDGYSLTPLFIGDGLVAPFRLMAAIMKTIRTMHRSSAWSDRNVGTSLVYNIAIGPSMLDPDECYDVCMFPAEAYILARHPDILLGQHETAFHLRPMAPDAWTAVILRDGLPMEGSPPETGHHARRTCRFRIVLLRARTLIPASGSRDVSFNDFEAMALPAFSRHPSSSEAADCDLEMMEDDGPNRTMIQFLVEPWDAADAVDAVQETLHRIAAQAGHN